METLPKGELSNLDQLELSSSELVLDEASRPATLVRRGAVVSSPLPAAVGAEGSDEGVEVRSAGEQVGVAWIEGLGEDLEICAHGPDAPGRFTAQGEGLELVLGDRSQAELGYRRALQADGQHRQAHESLRRLHRASGNWRTVAQLYAREVERSEGERRAQLQVLLELLCRTRSEAGMSGPLSAQVLEGGLPPVYGRLEAMLKASQALSSRSIERALALREELAALNIELDGDGEAAEGPEGFEGEALRGFQEWTWSAANLRRFLMKDARGAMGLLTSVYHSGRREPELLEVLAELLEEQSEWDRLRAVLRSALDEGSATATEYEALASLLEHRYRDVPGAVEVLQRGVERFPDDATLARRLVEALASVQEHERLIDALGNMLEATSSRSERAEILYQIGRLFEDSTCRTSSAIEVFIEAVASQPHHGPTLRSLGRVFARQNNWYGLADIYEKELAAPAPLPDAWRRHFRLGELYEEKHSNRTAALRHYQAVLAVRPTFLPALEAVARLLSEEGDWDDLARLYIASSRHFRGRRRQIDLLEKAARLAEEKVGNDLLLGEALKALLEVDPESTWATDGLARLYRRTRQWEALIGLHLREASFTEDAEETATLFWTCGRIAEVELHDPARAEKLYRDALGTTPDFAPALGCLGRLLAAEGRDEELLAMSEAELEVTEDVTVRARRMEAMAEILERRLGRRTAAIEMYERILESGAEETTALDRLIGLYSEQGRWDQVAELVERKATGLSDEVDAAEQWHRLGEARERRLGDAGGALDAYASALAVDPDHLHALRGVLRLPTCPDKDRDQIVARVAKECATADVRRVALRHLARRAEVSSDNPAAGMEHRRAAVEQDPNDREARDMLEAAFAHRRDMPGLVGLWAAAGRTVDEGLLGLLGAGAGIDAAALLETFLARWGAELEGLLEQDGRRAVWLAALGEVSRSGLQLLASRGEGGLLARLPGSVRRRVALAALAGEEGPSRARRVLSTGKLDDPACLYLRALLSEGDKAARVEAMRQEVDQLQSAELRVRRLLELVEDDPSRRRAWLRRAVGQEAFDSPVQERLYEALEALAEWELLGESLEAHLCADDLTPQRRSVLAFRLGRSIERRGGDPLEALGAYRTSFHACTERHDALLDIARLALEHGDKWDAIRSLEAFMTLSTELEQRWRAGLRLSELYLSEATPPPVDGGYNPYAGPLEYDGGPFGRKAVQLLAQLREEVRGTIHAGPCISRLAHAHAAVGSPYRAVELFQEVLTGDVSAEQVEDWLALAGLYWRSLGDLTNAEQILWLVWSTLPDRFDLLEQLVEVSRQHHTIGDTCQRVEETARRAAPEVLTAAHRRRLLELVAGLYAQELGHWRSSAALWGELADGTADEAQRRRLRVRQAQALCRVSGEEAACHRLMLELHRQEPFDLAPYEGLQTLYEQLDDLERLRMVQQIRYVLDPAAAEELIVDAVRRKTRPTRSFEAELLHAHMLPEGLRGGVLGVLQALVPLALKVWGEQVPTVEALGGQRWKANEFEQIAEMATTAAGTFGMPKVRLYLSDSGPGTPQVFAGSVPALWFHRGMFDGFGPEVGRFWAGYAAAMAWSQVAPLCYIDGRDLWHLLEGVLIKQTGTGLSEVTDPRSTELAEAVGGLFNASVRKRVAEVSAPCLLALRQAHCEAWPSMIHVMATRAGLVLSGQVSGAVQAMLRGRQWRGHVHDKDTQEHLRKLPEVAELLRFALGEDYQTLRYGCGLSARIRRIA